MVEFPQFMPSLVEEYVRRGSWPSTNIPDVLDRSSKYYPDKVAVVDVGLLKIVIMNAVRNLLRGPRKATIADGSC